MKELPAEPSIPLSPEQAHKRREQAQAKLRIEQREALFRRINSSVCLPADVEGKWYLGEAEYRDIDTPVLDEVIEIYRSKGWKVTAPRPATRGPNHDAIIFEDPLRGLHPRNR